MSGEPAIEAPKPTGKKATKLTSYHVFRLVGDSAGLVMRDISATSALQAIRAHLVDKVPGEGSETYVAVPSRSWKPVTVAVKQQTVISFTQ